MLHAVSAVPLMIDTVDADAVTSVEAAWNTNTAFGSPWASNVTVPLSSIVPLEYTPGVRVCPARSTGVVAVTGPRPAASS